MASLASESWIMLQIRLQAIIWSYGLAQAGEEDLSPFSKSQQKEDSGDTNLEQPTHFDDLS